MNLARIHAKTPDELHEDAILACHDRWLEGDATWSELVDLIEQRSPQQIARMEQERGL